MRDISDVLTVSFESGLKDESALCVTRKHNGETIMLKMELGEQADILYHLLTEQMTKAKIKEESDGFFGDDRDFLTQEQIENLQQEDANE